VAQTTSTTAAPKENPLDALKPPMPLGVKLDVSHGELASDVKERVRQRFSDEISFVPHNDYLDPQQRKVILEWKMLNEDGVVRFSKGNTSPFRVLTREEEFGLFRRYNLLRALQCELQKEHEGLRPSDLSDAALAEFARLEKLVLEVRNFLLESNVRLLTTVAKRLNSPSLTFRELAPEGIDGLLRAIDRFDVTAGTKFSSYAAVAISRQLWRTVEIEQKRCTKLQVEQESGELLIEDRSSPLALEQSHAELAALLSHIMKNELTVGERAILEARFFYEGLEQPTLQSLGDSRSRTKERIRQIERDALHKLKRAIGRYSPLEELISDELESDLLQSKRELEESDRLGRSARILMSMANSKIRSPTFSELQAELTSRNDTEVRGALLAEALTKLISLGLVVEKERKGVHTYHLSSRCKAKLDELLWGYQKTAFEKVKAFLGEKNSA